VDAQTEPRNDKLERELERVERFRRVAGHRANKALDYIESLMRTADRSRYHYSDKQAGEVIAKLRQGVDQLEAAYASKRDKRLRVEL
jgi:predicted RecB family endonuclease